MKESSQKAPLTLLQSEFGKPISFADDVDLIVGSKEKLAYLTGSLFDQHRYGKEMSIEMSKGNVTTRKGKTQQH